MSHDWIPTRLGQLVSIKHGWPFKSEHFSEELSGRPVVVAVGNFRYEGGFRFEETATKEYLDTYPHEFELSAGDILLVMTCQTQGGEILGIPARVPDDGRVYLHNQRLGKVVNQAPELIDDRFLYYLFKSRPFNAELCATASGSKILHTAPTRIEAFKFLRPGIDEQRAIAGILGALDDKIEQNRRTSAALERLARAMFRAWFVDFEPVRAKAAGATSFASMPQAVFDALPASFTDSSLGPIPQGWEAGAIGEAATISKEQLKPHEHAAEMFEHFSIPAYDDAKRPALEFGSTIKSNKSIVQQGCLLISKLNPRIPRVWLPPDASGLRQIASTEFLVTVPREGWGRNYLYCLFQQPEFCDELAQGASGTSNSHQRVRPADFLAKSIVVPPANFRTEFAAIVNPMMDLSAALHAESDKLAELRDYLLPKLLSGQVRASDAANAAVATG